VAQGPRRGGRPINPTLARLHVRLDPALKRRLAIAAATDGVAVHQVLAAALRAYLTKRGIR